MCSHLCLYYTNHTFILMSPTLSHYHMGHSRLLLFICNFLFHQRETWHPPTAIHFLNCTITYSGVRIFTSVYSQGRQLYQQVFSTYVRFFFLLVLQIILTSSNLDQQLLLLFPSVRLFQTFVIHLDCFVTFPFHPETP